METPDLSRFLAVHDVARARAGALAGAVATLAERDRGLGAALRPWFRRYRSSLLHQQHVEEHVWFDALLDRVPVLDHHLGRIAEEHALLTRLLDDVAAALDGLADPTVPWPDAADAATAATAELHHVLDGHVGFEDRDVLPLFVRHFDADEYRALERRAFGDSQGD